MEKPFFQGLGVRRSDAFEGTFESVSQARGVREAFARRSRGVREAFARRREAFASELRIAFGGVRGRSQAFG